MPQTPAQKRAAEQKRLKAVQALLAAEKARAAELERQRLALAATKKEIVAGKAEAATAATEARAAAAELQKIAPKKTFDEAMDAITANTLKSYGLNNIAATVAKIRADNPEISQDDLLFLLKNDTRYNSEYLTRFAGNKILKAKGLPMVSDADYLKAEKEYEKITTAFAVPGLATREYYATFIGNSMDADDLSKRLTIGYQVYNGSPQIKKAFNTFFGTLTDGDVVAAMVAPDTQIEVLQRKLDVAQIGAAALSQNLETSLVRATDLQTYGVTEAQAKVGYSTIKQGMAPYEKLLEISSGTDVKTGDVQTALENAKLKNDAEELLRMQRESEKEINRFSGSAGRLASQNRAQGLI